MNFKITIIEDNLQEKERLLNALHTWEEKKHMTLDISDYS